MKEFEEYLPIWSEEKMLPIPTIKHPDRWAVAWGDFIKEVITPRKQELIDDYTAMKFKTVGMAEKEKREKEREEREKQEQEQEQSIALISTSTSTSTSNPNSNVNVNATLTDVNESTVEEKPMSEWEKVQAIMRGEL